MYLDLCFLHITEGPFSQFTHQLLYQVILRDFFFFMSLRFATLGSINTNSAKVITAAVFLDYFLTNGINESSTTRAGVPVKGQGTTKEHWSSVFEMKMENF